MQTSASTPVTSQKPDHSNGAMGEWQATSSSIAQVVAATSTFKADYARDGFAIVKGVFSLDEVLEMRRRCAAIFERTAGKIGDVATYPELREILLDDRIVSIARALLVDPVYFGDSTFYANSRFDRHMHNDARGDVEDPSRSTYSILRMGLYLQDHAFHSNGLKVRPGSHRRVFWNVRNGLRLMGVGGSRLSVSAFRPTWYYNAPTEPGDLVFWNLRTHHAGHAVRLRAVDGFALPPSIEHLVPARFARPMPKDRFAIFSSWGRQSPELDAYIKQLGYSPHYRDYWQRSTFDSQESRAAFAQQRIAVRDDVLRLYQLGA
jgi:hypothetical protein